MGCLFWKVGMQSITHARQALYPWAIRLLLLMLINYETHTFALYQLKYVWLCNCSPFYLTQRIQKIKYVIITVSELHIRVWNFWFLTSLHVRGKKIRKQSERQETQVQVMQKCDYVAWQSHMPSVKLGNKKKKKRVYHSQLFLLMIISWSKP